MEKINLFWTYLFFCCKDQTSSYKSFQHYWTFHCTGWWKSTQNLFNFSKSIIYWRDRANSYYLANNPLLCTRHCVKYFKVCFYLIFTTILRVLYIILLHRYNNTEPLRGWLNHQGPTHSQSMEPEFKSSLSDPKPMGSWPLFSNFCYTPTQMMVIMIAITSDGNNYTKNKC